MTLSADFCMAAEKFRWTQENIKKYKYLYEESEKPMLKIAAELGIGMQILGRRIRFLKKINVITYDRKRSLSAEEKQEIIQNYQENPEQEGDSLATETRSKTAIYHIVSRARIVGNDRFYRRKPWTPEEILFLIDCATKHITDAQTSQLLCERCGNHRSLGAVRKKREEFEIKLK